ncbi:MAG: hypothetical protein E6X52_00250 [Actinomyces sp.]|uniref:hypothetical protein n=1 Tax=Actinomycetaceae TaxID=2049 RepID=UPI0026594712|nr:MULTISPECIES: hypothetical protein [Actinomycetaceae]MDK7142718.1 hypothetical protein [Gleimia europaea]MDU4830964.1 hypothetical protein [Actinomyces sp.]MDU6679335.1 hypothetical protein [Actinomyces sp.]MDU7239223.1 hypothetical protein [Actinomyces sp.]
MSQLKSFSDSVLKVAIHYVFARTHGLAPIKTDEDSGELAGILAVLGVTDPEGRAEQILALAAASKRRADEGEGSSLSAQKYDQIRAEILAELGLKSVRGVRLWPPTYQTIMQRFGGTWAGAMKACGLAASSDGKVGRRNARFSEADRIRAIRAYLAECERTQTGSSYAGYARWAKENGRPSGSNIRQVYGTWNRALEQLEGLENA